MWANDLTVSTCHELSAARHPRRAGGDVANVNAKSTQPHGVPTALIVATRNALPVTTYLLQLGRCSKSPADDFDARTQGTHGMQDRQPSTPELTRGDGGSVAWTDGRLTPACGENSARTVTTRGAYTAH
jgi:hypothetical protein